MKSKHIAIIQARMGSTRFPGKSMVKIVNKPLIWHIVHRLKKSEKLSKIYLATSVSPENDILERYVSKLGVEVIRGSEENVFSRFESIYKQARPRTITRVCGDCPLIDPKFIDRIINIIEVERVDHVVANEKKSIHQGINIVSANLFNQLLPFRDNAIIKEHVLSFEHLNLKPIKKGSIILKRREYESDIRLSVDTPSDLSFVKTLYKVCKAKAGELSTREIVKQLKITPQLSSINKHVYQKTVQEKTTNVYFLYDEESGSKMFDLARHYIENEGIGVRFLIEKNIKNKSEFDKKGVGILSYGNKEELINIIRGGIKEFIIAEKLPERMLSEVKLKIHSCLGGSLKKYKYVNIPIIK